AEKPLLPQPQIGFSFIISQDTFQINILPCTDSILLKYCKLRTGTRISTIVININFLDIFLFFTHISYRQNNIYPEPAIKANNAALESIAIIKGKQLKQAIKTPFLLLLCLSKKKKATIETNKILIKPPKSAGL